MTSDPTLTDGAGGAPDDIAEGARVFDRYRLVEPLGRGGAGTVWAAVDELTNDAVAVKFVSPMHDHARMHYLREVAVLLVLRMPGVVRFRDEGIEGRHQVLVTDRVHGEPFSVMAGRDDWWPSVVRLLEILAQVHLAGIVHRDLKPGNVLVDGSGQPTILDFGLARGALAPAGDPDLVEGTPRYMAPEQRVPDRAIDARADLYAVGLMVLELLTGSPPSSPPELRSLQQLPEPVRNVVTSMLADDPNDRPASALAALRALDLDPLPDTSALGAGPWAAEQLETLFLDVPYSLTHVAEDGAAALYRATNGEPGPTLDLLRTWILSGFVRWSEGRIVITRDALARLAALAPESPERTIVDQIGEHGLVLLALRRAEQLHDRGATRQAVALLDSIAAAVRGTPEETALLEGRVRYRLSLRDPAEVDVALHAVMMSNLGGRSRASWSRLLRGARAMLTRSGDAGLLEPDPELPPTLLVQQKVLGSIAALWSGEEPRALDQLPPEVRARMLTMAAYRAGRFEEAATRAEEAGRLQTGTWASVQAWIAAGASRAELGQFARALEHLHKAEQLAREYRIVVREDEARWHRRVVQYRAGHDVEACPAHVDAAASLGAYYAGRTAFVEALVAWRRQDPSASALAARAAEELGFELARPLVVLVQAFAFALGVATAPPHRIADASAKLDDDFDIQVIALLARGGHGLGAEARRRALQKLAASERNPHLRLDVLTLDECRVALTAPDIPTRDGSTA